MPDKVRQRWSAILLLLSSRKPEPAPYPVFLKCDQFIDSGFLSFKVNLTLARRVQYFANIPPVTPKYWVTPPHPLLQLGATISFVCQPRRLFENVLPLAVIPRPVIG